MSEVDGRSVLKKRRLNTQLLVALNSHDLDKVESLLESGANPNCRCRESLLTACHIAAYLGLHETLVVLLRAGADPGLRDRRGLQPHHLLAYHFKPSASLHCLDAIFDKDSSLVDSPVTRDESVDNQGEEELDSFVHNHEEITKMVPENVTEGSTLLFIAAKLGLTRIVEKLLARGADVNKKAENSLTALDVAGLEEVAIKITGRSGVGAPGPSAPDVGSRSSTIFGLLLRSDARATWTALHSAVLSGNVEAVRHLLQSVSPKATDGNGKSFLHLAIENEKKTRDNRASYNQVLAMLLDADKSAMDSQDFEGKTPLFLAVEGQWMEDVELLLQEGADVTVHSNSNENVFHLASKYGNCELLKEFLDINSSQVVGELLNARDNTGYTPLFRAVECSHYPCIEVLLEYPCSIMYVETYGRRTCTLVHLAVAASKTDLRIVQKIIIYLVSNNRHNLNERNENGMTPVELAAFMGNKKCLEILLDVNEVESYFSSSLNEDNEIVNLSLHLAAKFGHYETMKYLLDRYPVLVGLYDGEKRSALITAALRGHGNCVYLLLSRGANLAEIDKGSNRTAIDIIMNFIPEPVQMIEDLLNSFTGVEKKPTHCHQLQLEPPKDQPDRDDFEVRLDFSCLVAGSREMEVIEAVSECRFEQLQRLFFLHPLVKSFLALKWKRFECLFAAMSFLYLTHVLSVSGLALLFRQHQFSPLAWICRGGIWLTIVPVVFLEITNWILNGKIYSEAEIYTKWFGACTAVVLSAITDVWWGNILASVAVLLAWMVLLLFYAMSPKLGLYILMFFEVITNVFQVLSTFVFLFVGFALSFFVLFNGSHPFTDVWSSLCEVLAMMSELGYNDFFDGDQLESKAFKVTGRLLYLGFLFLVIMVLSNIILGMSVGDVTQVEGRSKHLAKQGSFLSLVDKFCYSKKLMSWLPGILQRQINKIFKHKLQYYRVYPNRRTGQSIVSDKELLYEIMTIVSGRKSRTEDNGSLTKTVLLTAKRVDQIHEQLEEIHAKLYENVYF